MKTTSSCLLLLSWLPCAAADTPAVPAFEWPASSPTLAELPAFSASLPLGVSPEIDLQLPEPVRHDPGAATPPLPAELGAWERWLADAGQYSVPVGDLRFLSARREAVPEGPVPLLAGCAGIGLVLTRLLRRRGAVPALS